jgi:hypothetical protein
MYIVNDQPVTPLSETVSSGKVMLDPATGEDLLRTLAEQIDQVDSWLERAGRLARPAPLGQNPVSDAMTSKFTGRAEGEYHSFVNILTAYRTVLTQTHESIGTALENYTATDEESRDEMTRISNGS